MSKTALQDLVAADMQAVDQLIIKRLSSGVVLINQMGHYIVNSGGKRLRPMLVVLSSRACGYSEEKSHLVAAIIEFIHTATLLHDDVVDESAMRRGRETANALWGNEASVLVGDFLYSRAFEMMVDVGDMRVMEILAGTTNIIAEGEVMQLLNIHDADTTEERYLDVIYSKTAKLFEAATRLGAVLAGRSEEEETALANYGMHLGTAFQLVDDILDYTSDSDTLGKEVGDDLAEGKPTLPLIHAMREGDEAQEGVIREAIEKGGRERIDEVLQIIEQLGSLSYTSNVAKNEAQKAVECLNLLPDSEHKELLTKLAHQSVERAF